MGKTLIYLKYLGIFLLFVLGISVVTALINLTGLNSTLVSKLGIILSAISFFVVVLLASRRLNEKGYLLGIKLGLIFVISLILINLIIFKSPFNIDRIIYYIILLASGILGGSFGKNLKPKK